MKPDDVLKACAERGGVLGLEAAPHTTVSREHPTHTIESVMDHFTYAVDLMGIEHLAFGPDLFYGDHVGFHHASSGNLGMNAVLDPGGLEFDRVSHVDGLENTTESFRNIAGWLVTHGYSDSEIKAVRACMSSSPSSTPPVASGSSVSPHIRPGTGSCSSDATSSWTSRTRAAGHGS